MTDSLNHKCIEIVEALEKSNIDNIGLEVCLASLCGSIAKLARRYDRESFINMINDCALEAFDETDSIEEKL